MIRIVNHNHTCWVNSFSGLSRERTIHYMIVLIVTVFLIYALVSNCYLVMIFFIRIIRKMFEFTLHTHSWSFTNIIVLCRLGSVHVIFFILLLSRKNRVQKKNINDSSLPQQELARISNFSHSSMFGSIFGTVRLGH